MAILLYFFTENVIYAYFALTFLVDILCIGFLIKNKFRKRYENIIIVNTIGNIIYTFLSFEFLLNIGLEILFVYVWIGISFLLFFTLKLIRYILQKKKIIGEIKKIPNVIKIIILLYSIFPSFIYLPSYIKETQIIQNENIQTILTCKEGEFLNMKT